MSIEVSTLALEFLKDGPKTSAELAKLANSKGRKSGPVLDAISMLRKSGHVKLVKRNKQSCWYLVDVPKAQEVPLVARVAVMAALAKLKKRGWITEEQAMTNVDDLIGESFVAILHTVHRLEVEHANQGGGIG